MIQRRTLLRSGAALGTATALVGCAGVAGGAGPKVVVVGGGYAGATAAKYIRMWSQGQIQVTLVEPNAAFVSCPISNLVIGGSKSLPDITTPYDNLVKRHGVQLVRDRVAGIDVAKRRVRLAGGGELAYDRLIVSPGVDFMWETLPGLSQPQAQAQVLHAWKAGEQTLALRRQLEAMPDGGVFAMSIPLAPYRCPPGPYERACQVAEYFSKAKPRSKVLILDANEDVTSKGPLFKKAWAERYAGIVEYRPKHVLADVDLSTRTLKFEFNDDLKADVLNIIPNMRAGDVAVNAGLATANKRWCDVDFLTFESKAAPAVHVLGDAIQIAPAMPKSGHMANQEAKVCAGAIAALSVGQPVPEMPIIANTCYSFISQSEVIHVAAVYRYDAEKKTMVAAPGAGGLSAAPSVTEGLFAMSWANNIMNDTLG